VQGIIFKFQEFDLNPIAGKDPERLEFRPSRRPRCCHSYKTFDARCRPVGTGCENKFLKFGTDHDPRWTHTRVQGVDEVERVFTSMEREGAEVFHGEECPMRGITGRVTVVDSQLFGLRSVKSGQTLENQVGLVAYNG